MSLCDSTFRLLVRSAVLLSILELLATVAFGQDSKSSRLADLRTVVSDSSGARIPRAEITFKGEKTVIANAGENGSIRVQIPHGSYSVTISAPGWETAKIASLAIQAAKPPDLEVVLQVGHCCVEPPIGGDGHGGGGPQFIASDLPNVIESGRVPDAATAVQIAEIALVKAYGKRQIDWERPLTAVLDGGIWTVSGTLCCRDRKGTRTCEVGKCIGGVASLKLRQRDGKIMSMSHTK